MLADLLGAHRIVAGVHGRPMEPSGQRSRAASRRRTSRQHEEHRLSDILRQVRIPDPTAAGRVDEARVSAHQLGESRLRAPGAELFEQFPIVHGSRT